MIIGRDREKQILNDCFESKESEFIAIYGRRRVGKTFLIKELFGERFTFYSTGVLNGDKDTQLQAWNNDIQQFGGEGLLSANNWIEAFNSLNKLVERSCAERKVIFLDEIPWMATLHSDFLAGLDYFWNRWASSRKDVMLIVCGSAATWICNNIVNSKGGLHNRITRRVLLEQFSLKECEQYYNNKNIPMTRYQMAEAYMAFGGIPYYMSLMKPQYSLYQNMDRIYFEQDAVLSDEFENLYKSLFSKYEYYIQIIEALAKKGIGQTRSEIVDITKITDGGSLTKALDNLKLSGFIREYKAYGQKKKDSLFQLVDFFSMFDTRFRNDRAAHSNDFWLRFSSTNAHSIWGGFSYEKLCLLHLSQIRQKLGISGVLTSAYSWRGSYEGEGTQVDLVIDRNDNIVNLCEVKFSSSPYQIDKKYYEQLQKKRSAFRGATHTRKFVQTTMITTFGLVRNSYGSEIVSEVTLDDLFE